MEQAEKLKKLQQMLECTLSLEESSLKRETDLDTKLYLRGRVEAFRHTLKMMEEV